MALYNIRSPQLSFDENQEADIIKCIEYMNDHRCSGKFLSDIIRIAFDCPNLFDENTSEYKQGAIFNVLKEQGLSESRQAFFKNINNEVKQMQEKVDKMYNMIFEMYILSKAGKQLGLEQKAENALLSQFVVEKQLKDLQDLLGCSLSSSVLASNKVHKVDELSEEIVAYIIEHYSNIIEELKKSQNVTVVKEIITENKIETTTTNAPETPAEAVDDEYVDFGDADIGSLNNFFGTQQE